MVLLTSLTEPTEIVRGLESGADNFVRKPYDPAQLVSRLQAILHHRKMRLSGKVEMGMEVMLRDRRFMITAERQQILDLLISSFEDLVTINDKLREREEDLTRAHRELHNQLEALERERQRMVAVLAAVPNAMAIVDAKGMITESSERYSSLIGTTTDDLVGNPAGGIPRFTDAGGAEVAWNELPLGQALQGQDSCQDMGASFDLFLETPSGGTTPVIASAAPVRDSSGRVIAAVGVLHEIGLLAAHDPLTKLPNHALFTDRLARAVSSSARLGRPVGVLAVAIDRFVRFRQSLSPVAVDRVVAEAAARLQRVMRTAELGQASPETSLGYFGDDLFGVVLPELADEVDAVRLAHQIVDALASEVDTGEVTLSLTASVGVAVTGQDGDDPVHLVASAAAAARRASVNHRSVEAADPSVDARAGDELRREADLRTAISGGQLEVHYQPQVNLETGAVFGFEALVRWRHPQQGLVPPVAFIPLAEETGLIGPLGWCVLEEACRQTAEWRARLPGAKHAIVSVNLAASQLADDDVTYRVESVLDKTGLDPFGLVLEMTESGVMADAPTAVKRLDDLKSLGVGLAIDDFGTGYSSLLQLRRFPVDALKIDRAFVACMTDEAADAAIVVGTVRLAQALGIDTVAEGVETCDQLAQLRVIGCEMAQGFHWSKALPSDQLERWWLEHRQAQAESVASSERGAPLPG